MAYAHPDEEEKKDRMIRLSCKGSEITFGGQKFKGVNPDIYIHLDRGNFVPYNLTIKMNVTIQVNPAHWRIEEFLAHFTNNHLAKTHKCHYHGDEDTGLTLSPELEKLLKPAKLPIKELEGGKWGFQIYDRRYQYYSVGIAANPHYGAVSTRQGNEYENKSSHFEIKFQRLTKMGDYPRYEYLCLNIHLLATPTASFGKAAAIQRLDTLIRFFYHELGLLQFSGVSKFYTGFRGMLEVTLDNYEKFGLEVRHPVSLENLKYYLTARPYIHFDWKREIKKTAAPVKPPVFTLLDKDFPAL